jgi:hypothetical protein
LAVVAGHARGARCAEPCARLTAPSDLPTPWADAVRDLTRALAELPPTQCRTTTLFVELADGAVRLVAQGQDGGRAVRSVAQPSSLVPIALGLVISIPSEEAADTASPAPPANAISPAPAEIAPSVPASSSAAPPPGAVSAHPVAVWLGVAVGARIGVPSAVSMADVEARVDLRIDRLILFVSFRNVPIGFVAGQGFDGDAYHESSIAFGVGRSMPLGPYSLDVSIAPSLVTMRMSKDQPEAARANDVELRVGASARLNVPFSATWHLTFAVDTEVIPDGLRSADRVDPLPAFPSWTSGLCVGVAGAVL